MKKEAWYLVGAAGLCVGLAVWKIQSNTRNAATDAAAEISQPQSGNGTDIVEHSHDHSNPKAPINLPRPPKLKPEEIRKIENDLSFVIDSKLREEDKEQKALSSYSRAFYVFSNNEQKPETLVKKLAQAGLKPVVAQDFNDVTGKMITVTTENTLPGTRYFQAQYFEDENGKPFLQHMSFEFRPDEKSYSQALETMNQQFPGLQFEHCNDKFAAAAHGDYTVWCTHLRDIEDTQIDDPRRAYSPDDINTTRCAIEINPHPQEGLCGD